MPDGLCSGTLARAHEARRQGRRAIGALATLNTVHVELVDKLVDHDILALGSQFAGAGHVFAAGLCGQTYVMVLSHGRAGFADRLVGRVVTSLNMAVFLGIGIFQATSGWIIRWFQLPDGSIPEHGFRVLFGFLATMVFVALLIYRTSSEARPSEDTTRKRIG